MQLAYNNKRDKLDASVSYLIPAAITGSGLGANQVNSATTTSNYSLTQFKQYGVVNLRIGDLGAIIDADTLLAGSTEVAPFRRVWLSIPTVFPPSMVQD